MQVTAEQVAKVLTEWGTTNAVVVDDYTVGIPCEKSATGKWWASVRGEWDDLEHAAETVLASLKCCPCVLQEAGVPKDWQIVGLDLEGKTATLVPLKWDESCGRPAPASLTINVEGDAIFDLHLGASW